MKLRSVILYVEFSLLDSQVGEYLRVEGHLP